MKKVLIFGSTGSVGKNALSVIKKAPDKFRVLGLCANSDIKTLTAQIKEFRPRYVCLKDAALARRLARSLPAGVKLFSADAGLRDFAGIACDISVMAISGISALQPLFWNLKHAQRVALANKEAIVTAGEFILRRAKRFNTEIIPVDSEINSLFQLFGGSRLVHKVYLTASGGALIDHKKRDLARVRPREVLSHPTWRMGRRITVDCATLVNKAFEVVETHHFFDLAYEKIDIVVHRESRVHAMLEFCDSTIFACIYPPDMKLPIAFSLYYPQRSPYLRRVGFRQAFSLSFEPLDIRRFAPLNTVLAAARRGGNSLAVVNACDEVAVDYFLKGRIKFTHIAKILEYIFQHHPSAQPKSVGEVLFWDDWARRKAKEYIKRAGLKS